MTPGAEPAVTRLQQLGIDRLSPAERVALARELLASVVAEAADHAGPGAADPSRARAAGPTARRPWEDLTVRELSRVTVSPPVPADEWERRLFTATVDCGVSVPDSALSSDGLYD